MSKRKKWLACLSIAFVAAFAGAVTACDQVADNLTPYIGENGNWWVGDEDLGVPATGSQGEKGEKGDTGEKGFDGEDGQDGANGDGIKSITVDENGRLIITLTSGYEFDLGKVTGEDGKQGEKGEPGEQGETGEKGEQGEEGEDGRGIADVVVDKYGTLVIVFTDDTTQTFELGASACVHSYSDWSVGVEATCSSMGYDMRSCDKCDDVDYRFNAAMGHSYGDWWAVSADGSMQCRTCLFCDETQTAHTIHTYVDGNCVACGEPQTQGLTYLYIEAEDGYRVIGLGTCTDAEIYIPSTYMGKPVVAIGTASLDGNPTMTKLTIGKNVKEIGAVAFYDCDGLTEVLIPDNVETIGGGAFRNCDNLAKVTIGGGVQIIDYHAFADCVLLADIVIPDNVKTIGSNAFSGTGLTSATFANVSGWQTGETVISEAELSDTAMAAVYLRETYKEYTWGWTLQSQGLAFTAVEGGYVVSGVGTCTDAEIYIPQTYEGQPVIGIADNAFYQSTQLASVHIPESVLSIGDMAFLGCTSLEKIVIPDSVQTIGGWAFYDAGLKNVTIGAGVKTIQERTFRGTLLESVTIPDNVETIGMYAFLDCSSLKSVTFGKNVTKIDHGAFSRTFLQSVVIPDGVQIIDSSVFSDCTALKSVTFGKNVTRINLYAFLGSNLETVNYEGKLVDWFTIRSELSYLLWSAKLYINGVFLEDLVIPETVQSVKEEAFRGYRYLKSVTLHDDVKRIGDRAFLYCTGLTSVTLGKGLREIGAGAFSYCSLLESVTIPKRATLPSLHPQNNYSTL